MSVPILRRTDVGVRLTVRVQPRAAANALGGVHGSALKIRLTAPPVDGAANEALRRFLADTFRIPLRDVTIVSGAGSRMKVVELAGITEDRVRQTVER